MFHLNMFVNALFRSDVGFRRVSSPHKSCTLQLEIAITFPLILWFEGFSAFSKQEAFALSLVQK